MKWISAKVTFDFPDQRLAVDLVADIFYTLNLKGVVVDDPERDLTQDWGEDAIPPPKIFGVTGYFPDTPGVSEQCRSLEMELKRLERKTGLATRISYTRIDEQDWAEAWKEHFWPEKVTERLVIKPTWRDYAARPEETIVEIDPGMAFGTGTHPTTSLCIRMIETYLAPGDCFLDVGTGSGILSIVAGKLGAGQIIAVDSDPVAVSVAERNLLVNGIDRKNFTLFSGNLVDQINRTVDLLAANILAEVILQLLPDVSTVLKPGGLFIGSGIIAEKRASVVAGLQGEGFTVVQVLEKEGWVAVAARK